MTKVRHSLSRTQSDDVAEGVSADSRHNLLKSPPVDPVDKISRYLESSAGRSGRDEASSESDSDSGNSLFITQKCAPEAVRSGRRQRRSLREDEGASYRKPNLAQRMKKLKYRLPTYSFSFLQNRKLKGTELNFQQNIQLHNAVMGGFFNCVRDLQSALPTVDTDEECISPISEEEEEALEAEDIRVVERKHFVASSKAKRSEPWCTPQKRDSRVKQQRRRPRDARHETSRGTTPILSREDTESSGVGDSSRGARGERLRSDEHVLDATETLKAKRSLARGKKKCISEQEEKEDDSDATLCEPNPEECIQKGREASTAGEGEGAGQNLLQSDTNNEASVKRRRKKKKRDGGDQKSVEEGKIQRQEEAEVTSVNVGVTEGEEAPSLSQTVDEPEVHEGNWTGSSSHDGNTPRREETGVPASKQKRKKTKSAAADVGQEADGRLESDVRSEEDSVFLQSCDVEDSGKRRENDEGGEQIKASTAAEPLNDDAKIQKKKKKRKNMTSDQTSEEIGDCLENCDTSQETSESSYVKRKKHKKKQQTASNDDTQVREEDCVDVSFTNDVIALAGLSVKKKKKKRTSERTDVSYTPEEEENVDNTQKTTEGQDAELVTKKKKKKKMKEMSSVSISSDTVAQSDDSVSVWKRERKRTSSFLVADAEGKAAQTHVEKHPPAAAHEKPGVSGDLTSESAEIAGSLEDSNDGVRKKKKKRKESVENDHEPDFEEPNETCQRAPAETEVRRKKKRKRSEKESENAAEAGYSQTEEDVVLKKKKKGAQEILPAATEDIKSALNACTSVT